jgi:glycosyltransferase involved in cell wall biosynthesis
MRALPNVRVLESVPQIDDALRGARLLLMPSLWYEGFGLIAMEAMLRALPVIASDAGGLVEAKAGTGYVVPVKPIERFEAVFDETHMPKPVDVPQEYGPWQEALERLLTNDDEYQDECERSRSAAVAFVSSLRASAFRVWLESLHRGVPETSQGGRKSLSAAQTALLRRRLKERTGH